MPKKYAAEIEVRGYELDSYGHVNHAVFLHYLEVARWKMLEEEGVRLQDFVTWKTWPVIAQIQVKYVKPAFAGERLKIQSEVVERTKTSFTIHQEILREGKLLLKAEVLSVLVNDEGRPTALPENTPSFGLDPE